MSGALGCGHVTAGWCARCVPAGESAVVPAAPALDDRASWIPAERAVRLAAAGAAMAAELEGQSRRARQKGYIKDAVRMDLVLAQWKAAVWAPIPLEAP